MSFEAPRGKISVPSGPLQGILGQLISPHGSYYSKHHEYSSGYGISRAISRAKASLYPGLLPGFSEIFSNHAFRTGSPKGREVKRSASKALGSFYEGDDGGGGAV